MRTNIEIDDDLMAEAKKISGNKTKKEIVEKALELLIKQGEQVNNLDLFGKIKWDGDLDEMRELR